MLTPAGILFMGKNCLAMLSQPFINQLTGIVVGTVYRFENDNWDFRSCMTGAVWQLIVIFDKVTDSCFSRISNNLNEYITSKTTLIIGTIGSLDQPQKEKCSPVNEKFKNHQNY